MSEKIKISGAPPKWNDAEFERRLDDAVKLYKLTTQSREGVHAALPHDFLEAVSAKLAEGYTVCRKHSVNFASLSYTCMLIKPEAMQSQDIEELKVKVKEEYVEWLESERARYQDLLRLQLIQTQQEKDAKALRDKEAKQLAEIEKQVQACYTPLEIPD